MLKNFRKLYSPPKNVTHQTLENVIWLIFSPTPENTLNVQSYPQRMKIQRRLYAGFICIFSYINDWIEATVNLLHSFIYYFINGTI